MKMKKENEYDTKRTFKIGNFPTADEDRQFRERCEVASFGGVLAYALSRPNIHRITQSPSH